MNKIIKTKDKIIAIIVSTIIVFHSLLQMYINKQILYLNMFGLILPLILVTTALILNKINLAVVLCAAILMFEALFYHITDGNIYKMVIISLPMLAIFIYIYFLHKKNLHLIDANYKNILGCTSLMHAAKKNNLKLAEYLIKENADIDAETNNGCTALMYASQNGNLEIVKYLLTNGADYNLKNNNGETALSFAKESNSEEIVSLLKSKGAK